MDRIFPNHVRLPRTTTLHLSWKLVWYIPLLFLILCTPAYALLYIYILLYSEFCLHSVLVLCQVIPIWIFEIGRNLPVFHSARTIFQNTRVLFFVLFFSVQHSISYAFFFGKVYDVKFKTLYKHHRELSVRVKFFSSFPYLIFGEIYCLQHAEPNSRLADSFFSL